MIYINLVKHYLTFSRSIRTGDFPLFKYILEKMANIFFIFNHQNYARWSVKYIDSLNKIQETHPKIHNELNEGHIPDWKKVTFRIRL